MRRLTQHVHARRYPSACTSHLSLYIPLVFPPLFAPSASLLLLLNSVLLCFQPWLLLWIASFSVACSCSSCCCSSSKILGFLLCFFIQIWMTLCTLSALELQLLARKTSKVSEKCFVFSCSCWVLRFNTDFVQITIKILTGGVDYDRFSHREIWIPENPSSDSPDRAF